MSHARLSDESTSPPGVLGLDHPASRDPSVVGAKAAALSVARNAGMPALYGFVVSTTATATWQNARPPDLLTQQLRRAWRHLGGAGSRPLIVRSSSPDEDGQTSSMAGRFTSVLDVTSWDALLAAAHEVIDSGHGAPIAVLVQRQLQPAWGGVLFGADPVTGSRDRLVVACVPVTGSGQRLDQRRSVLVVAAWPPSGDDWRRARPAPQPRGAPVAVPARPERG
jgi:phosphoenolpyruvate synthase/pyruvate phosphate dikinase